MPTPSPSAANIDAATRPVRRDVARNRLALLASARVLYAVDGVGVGFDEIAKHAGVGVGTIYRHFPSRDSLLEALFENRFAAVETLAQEAIVTPDAWDGLEHFIVEAVDMFSEDRGLREIAFDPKSDFPGLLDQRERLAILLQQVTDRAHGAKVLRSDCGAQDVGRIIAMLSRVSEPSTKLASPPDPEAAARCTRFVLDGIRVSR